MATNNFLIDAAQSAGNIANNIFNKAGNFASQGLQYSNAFIGNDAGLMETPEMKDYLKNLMLNRIRESGNLSGNELGYSDYDPKSTWSGPPNSLSTSTGLFSPNAAYQNTLGSGSFNVPEQGGYAQWKPSSTVYDFSQSLADKAGGFNPFNVINRGGLRDILIKDSKGTYKDGTSSLQHMIPNVEITPEEIQEIFGGGGMLHKGEGIQDRPEINSLNLNKAKAQATSTQPISQPTGTSATALAQIQANISAAATKEKLLNKKQSIAPIDRTKKTTAASGMMSSGGPPRRSSRAGRKKPAKTSYGRRYGL
jgi:hypothetical protein